MSALKPPPEIRAHIRPVRITVKRKGRVDSWMHWYMSITADGVTVNADDCRDLARLHEEATCKVTAFRITGATGQKLRPWWDLVDEARI